jgi:hypothetical protein
MHPVLQTILNPEITLKNRMLRACNVNPEEVYTAIETGKRINIATYTDGVCQVETATAAGTVTADPGGNATVTVTAAGMTGSPKAVAVALLLNDDANAIATKIRGALTADANVSAFFTVSGETDKVILTAKTAAENDTTMNIAIAAGTATGVTTAATSANTTWGSKNEMVHPSILYFPKGWNGYKYWLGYTCYDNGSSDFENPCIAVSNDNETWITPPGLTNPVEAKPALGYYADINLFMSADESTMYMVFKYNAGAATTYLRSTTNGITWTEKVELFTNVFEDVSPSVLYDEDSGLYKMWTIKHADTPNTMYLRTATNPIGTWSAPAACTGTIPAGELWHMEVRKVGNKYHAIFQRTGNSAIYFATSDDGLAFTFGSNAIVADPGYLYKPTMWPVLTSDGLKYGLWRNTIGPYAIYYTEMSFDKSYKLQTITNQANANLANALALNSPWIFCDTFNRADTITGLGTSDSGHTWTKAQGDELGISSNEAYLPTGGSNSKAIVNIGVSDFYAEVIFTDGAVSGGEGFLMFRYGGTGNFWRVGHYNGRLTLQKLVGGVLSTKNLGAHKNNISNGDRIGIECRGNSIKLYRNDMFLYETTDSFQSTSTNIGLSTSRTTAKFNNLLVKTV